MIGSKRLAAMAAVLAATAGAPALAASPKVGQPAPDFQVVTFDGKTAKLSDYRGQVLIVNIWATWCAPCRKELPLLDEYYRRRQDAGLRILAVTTEDSVPTRYLKPLSAVVSFPLAQKFKGSYRPIDGAVPSNFVIDRSGTVRLVLKGAFDLDSLNEVLTPLLNEPAPADASAPTVQQTAAR
jgi:peroxiredoxin